MQEATRALERVLVNSYYLVSVLAITIYQFKSGKKTVMDVIRI